MGSTLKKTARFDLLHFFWSCCGRAGTNDKCQPHVAILMTRSHRNENSKLLTGKTFSSSLNGWLMVSYVEVSQGSLVTVDISPHISIREVISSDQSYFSTSLPTIFPKRKTAMLSSLDRMSCSCVGLKHPSPLCSCIGFSSIIGFPLMTHHSDFRLKDKTSDFYFYHVTGWNVWSNRFISIFSPRKR